MGRIGLPSSDDLTSLRYSRNCTRGWSAVGDAARSVDGSLPGQLIAHPPLLHRNVSQLLQLLATRGQFLAALLNLLAAGLDLLRTAAQAVFHVAQALIARVQGLPGVRAGIPERVVRGQPASGCRSSRA